MNKKFEEVTISSETIYEGRIIDVKKIKYVCQMEKQEQEN